MSDGIKGPAIGGAFDGRNITSRWPVSSFLGPAAYSTSDRPFEDIQRYHLEYLGSYPYWRHQSLDREKAQKRAAAVIRHSIRSRKESQ